MTARRASWSSARATSGLPLAMRAVAAGHDVTGVDVSIDRVKRLAAGESFVEDVPSAELGRGARHRVATA